MSAWFMVHEGLADAARVPSLARSRDRLSALELLVLLASGAAASAAVGMAKLGLGIPGHSIVLGALPVALGLSLAPRHLAGSIMSAGAVGTGWPLPAGAVHGSGPPGRAPRLARLRRARVRRRRDQLDGARLACVVQAARP